MIIRVLYIILVSFLFTMPLKAQAYKANEDTKQEQMLRPTVTVVGKEVVLNSAKGKMLMVYNVAGVCVLSKKISSDREKISLKPAKGIFILKIGREVRKIVLA